MLVLQILVLWFAIGTLAVATFWYLTLPISTLFPEWWKRHICDEAPEWVELDSAPSRIQCAMINNPR